MSGGYFDYVQFRMEDAARELKNLIHENKSREYPFSPSVLFKFKLAADNIDAASKMLHQIDWLVSSDDSESTFLKNWEKL